MSVAEMMQPTKQSFKPSSPKVRLEAERGRECAGCGDGAPGMSEYEKKHAKPLIADGASNVSEIVERPPHYTGAAVPCPYCAHMIEPIHIIEHLPYNIGAALKYMFRCSRKGDPVTDLAKAMQYLQFEQARLRRNGNPQGEENRV